MSILIVGGGTGGHISPGIALYEEFRQRGISVHFLTGIHDTRFSSLADVAVEDLHTYRAFSFTKNVARLPLSLMVFALAMLRAIRLIKRADIDSVIGMGGYVSAPAIAAAIVLKRRVYLCEQNSVPGKVTRLFAKRARIIFSTFSASTNYLKGAREIVQAGNPVRKKALPDIGKADAKARFNLGHCAKVIFAIGGSQGALQINRLVVDLKKKFPNELRNVGFIWSTGDFSYQKYKDLAMNDFESGSLYISPFIDEVGVAYRASDVVIGRSGAGVMMEIAAMGLPSILVPYPYAANDHQDKNADEFVEAGASIKFSNSAAIAENVGPALIDLLDNGIRYRTMAERALAIAKTKASATIADAVLADK